MPIDYYHLSDLIKFHQKEKVVPEFHRKLSEDVKIEMVGFEFRRLNFHFFIYKTYKI